jgi:hypothetical protein
MECGQNANLVIFLEKPFFENFAAAPAHTRRNPAKSRLLHTKFCKPRHENGFIQRVPAIGKQDFSIADT